MTTSSSFLPEGIRTYLVQHGVREPEILARLRAETGTLAQAHYQIAPEEGQFLGWLLETIGARRTLDIGTFTGYSALVAALAMGPEGGIVTCDVSDDFTAIARRYWREAGVEDRIDLRLGPAVETAARLAESEAGGFDFVFIDADKENYPAYYEAALTLLRRGGTVAIDNTLWRGKVADPAETGSKTRLFRQFNAFLHADERVTLTIVPVGDGLTLARKR